MIKILAAVLLAAGFASGVFAEENQNIQVTIKGVLHEDKNGFFFQIDGMVYDIVFNARNKGDMHKFYADLKGDTVKVSGELHIQEVKDKKPYMIVYTNEIARVKGDETKVITRVETVERPVVREYYVEHRPGVDLPFVHIHW
jgi:hypothetical protein